ncbi:type II 3-dehydroquinate dehydratase [Alphaproteobacteria bacterium]|nr:type II 3-dehydroquinate dehydratase [Alphaproteobacteria bacterium]
MYIINGPNLNKLGIREPDKYGTFKLQEIEKICENKCDELNLSCKFFQSNFEGEIVNKIHNAIDENIKAIIINAAAYTHTSIAILDALKMFTGIIIEVHITNIHSREEFRHHSFISKVAQGIIAGFGKESYLMAIDYLYKLINKKV